MPTLMQPQGRSIAPPVGDLRKWYPMLEWSRPCRFPWLLQETVPSSVCPWSLLQLQTVHLLLLFVTLQLVLLLLLLRLLRLLRQSASARGLGCLRCPEPVLGVLVSGRQLVLKVLVSGRQLVLGVLVPGPQLVLPWSAAPKPSLLRMPCGRFTHNK